jgi:hypothetical protein
MNAMLPTPAEETVLSADWRPSRRPSVIALTLAGLCFLCWTWYIGLYTRGVNSWSDYFKLGGWLFVFSGFVFALSYELFGTESIRLAGCRFTIIRTLFGFSTRKIYDLTLMKNLQVIGKGSWSENKAVIPQGRIRFAYHGKTCEFGATLSDDEAFNLVRQVKEQISRLGG